jgi:hypothetical protein
MHVLIKSFYIHSDGAEGDKRYFKKTDTVEKTKQSLRNMS